MVRKSPESQENGARANGKRQRDTVLDVARLAEVSIATVSRVFSGKAPVAEKTRRRVLEAAASVGFRPNIAARALRTGKIETLAFALHASHLAGEFYAEVLGGFHHATNAQRLRVVLAVVPNDADPKAWLQEFVFSGWCEALAVHTDLGRDPAFLASLGVPVTLAGHCADARSPSDGVCRVGFDHRVGVLQSVRHLVALGHSRIACLTGTPGSQDTKHRVEGFRAGMAEAGLVVPADWVIGCSYEDGPRTGAAAVDRLFSGAGERPTAVVCGSDNIALGAIAGARRWGLDVPSDLSVVGFDDFLWASSFHPPLTTVEHKGWDLGVAVGETLLAQRRTPDSPPRNVVLPTRLIVRESTARPLR